MEIRHATQQDLSRIMEIYAHARRFMAQTGNPRQWGATNWPPERLIRRDIASRNSYVCLENDQIVGTFFYAFGEEIEPNYAAVEGGSWLAPGPYGVIHRLASAGQTKGVGAFCINWAVSQSGHLRIDTHGDNKVMQNLLEKLRFSQRGIVYVEEDNDPRLAYEKIV